MSSPIAHSITALGIYTLTEPHARPTPARVGWALGLVLVSTAPDADYFIRPLSPALHGGLRVSHALLCCLVLPLLGVLALQLPCFRTWDRRRSGLQVLGVGLSHLLLDLLVGVRPLPLLWPISDAVFKLPFGILPSAAPFSLSNYYFYRNLAIELGVLIPLFFGMNEWRHGSRPPARRRLRALALWIGSAGFMGWAFTLMR